MKPHDALPPIDEVRWQAQELARRGDPGADPLDLRIAHALRQAAAIDPRAAGTLPSTKGML